MSRLYKLAKCLTNPLFNYCVNYCEFFCFFFTVLRVMTVQISQFDYTFRIVDYMLSGYTFFLQVSLCDMMFCDFDVRFVIFFGLSFCRCIFCTYLRGENSAPGPQARGVDTGWQTCFLESRISVPVCFHAVEFHCLVDRAGFFHQTLTSHK
jgi:hypothetical protein